MDLDLGAVRAFYEDSEADTDIVASRGTVPQRTALTGGSVDAAFGRVNQVLPPGIERTAACLEPLYLLVGRGHRLARRGHVPVTELADLTAWMPGNARDSEWAEYYRFLSAEFGVRINTSGPVFGRDHLIERIGRSARRAPVGGRRASPGRSRAGPTDGRPGRW